MLEPFSFWDYVAVAIMLAISASIGVYYRLTGGKQSTVDEYLLADRSMGCLPVAVSLVVSFMSAVTILGYASENYYYGTQFMALNVAYLFGIPIVAYVYLPVFFGLRLTSAYEYLEKRFGRLTRLVASLVFQLQMVLYMSVVMFAPALALSAVTGLSAWISVMCLGAICTFYSALGGMKAVLWTDVFQGMLIFAAVLSVLLKGIFGIASLNDFKKVLDDGGRLEFFNLSVDPTVRHTFWTQVVGGIFTFTSIYGVNQAQVQRLLTIGNLKTSQMSLFFSLPFLITVNVMVSACGLVVYYHYRNCDPLTSGRIKSMDQLLPIFVLDSLTNYKGIAGLFVSGIFSATLSSVSSALNSLAAVTLEDYLKPYVQWHWSIARQALISKLLVLFYGVVCITLTYVAQQLGGVLQASFTVFGVVGGPLLGLFSLGMFTIRAKEKGALVGFLVSLCFVSWIGFGATIYKTRITKLPLSISGCNQTLMYRGHEDNVVTAKPTLASVTDDEPFYLYRLSYMWLASIGFTIVMAVGWLVSYLDGFNKEPVDSNLISPPFKYLYGFNRAPGSTKRSYEVQQQLDRFPVLINSETKL